MKEESSNRSDFRRRRQIGSGRGLSERSAAPLRKERVLGGSIFPMRRRKVAQTTSNYGVAVRDEMTPEVQKRYLAVAKQAAGEASKDEQVVGEAANHAVVQLDRYWHQVSTGDPERKKWVKVVATHYARKLGAKLHKELAMGFGGSEPPPMYDEQADKHVARLIADIHLGAGSLASLVATRVAFDERWALLSGETRSLLHAKYVDQMTLKEIAQERGRGESTGAIDHKLAAGRKVAQLLFEDLLDELRGRYPDELEDD